MGGRGLNKSGQAKTVGNFLQRKKRCEIMKCKKLGKHNMTNGMFVCKKHCKELENGKEVESKNSPSSYDKQNTDDKSVKKD